ncbi:MAG: hypothetical protein AABX39_02455 [Nanoarchaeota archaeon]
MTPAVQEPTRQEKEMASQEIKKYIISKKTPLSALELLLEERGSNEDNR